MGKLVEAFNALFPDEERDEYIEALADLKSLEDEGKDIDEAAIRADERAKTEKEMKIKFKKIILEPIKKEEEEEDITIEDLFEDKKEDED
nr:MAG TPA: hypothetical protein [Caudoviricetes sp.]